jgi:hypothetical protein
VIIESITFDSNSEFKRCFNDGNEETVYVYSVW